jgi:hypothetical protein
LNESKKNKTKQKKNYRTEQNRTNQVKTKHKKQKAIYKSIKIETQIYFLNNINLKRNEKEKRKITFK